MDPIEEYYFFQNKYWINDDIFKKWLDSIYLEY